MQTRISPSTPAMACWSAFAKIGFAVCAARRRPPRPLPPRRPPSDSPSSVAAAPAVAPSSR
jgi:hypothetical protein